MNLITTKLIDTNTVYYVGEKYYNFSSSFGSLYTEDGYRYDYGLLQKDLEQGLSVKIRPATKSIIQRLDALLAKAQTTNIRPKLFGPLW